MVIKAHHYDTILKSAVYRNDNIVFYWDGGANHDFKTYGRYSPQHLNSITY